MKPVTLHCDADPKDTLLLERAGGCAGLTLREGRKEARLNLTAPQAREAAAWLNGCAAEVEAQNASKLRLDCMPGCRTVTGRVDRAYCPTCTGKAHWAASL